MSIAERYSALAEGDAKAALQRLLSSTDNPSVYSATMEALGRILGTLLNSRIPNDHE